MFINLISKIVNILNRIGLGRKFINFVFGGEEFFAIDMVYNCFSDKISKRLTLLLPGRGCSWFKKSGGCTMCGFNKKLMDVNQRWNFSANDLFALYRIAELLSCSQKPEILCIFNGGSFLNEDEIPRQTQIAITRSVKIHPTFGLLFIESRPEFITEASIENIRRNLGCKRLEVGIGLEAVTNKVREVYIHKGFNLQDYEKAVKLLNGRGVYVLTYVFLKPLGISEREAIEEAMKTIQYAFKVGSDEVSISCAFIQDGTRMAKSYGRGEFRPPWLWSIIEVLRRTAHLGSVRVGSFNDNPPPIDIPHNCPKCSKRVENALQKYNLVRDISIFDSVFCECQKEWQREIEKA